MRFERLTSNTCVHDPQDIGYLLAWSLAEQLNEPLICRKCGQVLWIPQQQQSHTGLADFLKRLRRKPLG